MNQIMDDIFLNPLFLFVLFIASPAFSLAFMLRKKSLITTLTLSLCTLASLILLLIFYQPGLEKQTVEIYEWGATANVVLISIVVILLASLYARNKLDFLVLFMMLPNLTVQFYISQSRVWIRPFSNQPFQQLALFGLSVFFLIGSLFVLLIAVLLKKPKPKK